MDKKEFTEKLLKLQVKSKQTFEDFYSDIKSLLKTRPITKDRILVLRSFKRTDTLFNAYALACKYLPSNRKPIGLLKKYFSDGQFLAFILFDSPVTCSKAYDTLSKKSPLKTPQKRRVVVEKCVTGKVPQLFSSITTIREMHDLWVDNVDMHNELNQLEEEEDSE